MERILFKKYLVKGFLFFYHNKIFRQKLYSVASFVSCKIDPKMALMSKLSRIPKVQ